MERKSRKSRAKIEIDSASSKKLLMQPEEYMQTWNKLYAMNSELVSPNSILLGEQEDVSEIKQEECSEVLPSRHDDDPMDYDLGDLDENYDGRCRGCDSDLELRQCPDTNEYVCQDCGMINEIEVEQASYATRGYGGPNSSSINSYTFSGQSNVAVFVSGLTNRRMQSRQTWGSTDCQEKRLSKAFKIIDQICKSYAIPGPVCDSAKIYYQKLGECKQTKGNSKGKPVITRGIKHTGMIAACLFRSCVDHQLPHTKIEFGRMFDVDPKFITKGNSMFNRYISQNEDESFALNDHSVYHNPVESFAKRHARNFGFAEEQIEMVGRIARNIRLVKSGHDHSPASIGAGVVLLARDHYNLALTNETIATQFTISCATANKVYKKLSVLLEIAVSDELTLMLMDELELDRPE